MASFCVRSTALAGSESVYWPSCYEHHTLHIVSNQASTSIYGKNFLPLGFGPKGDRLVKALLQTLTALRSFISRLDPESEYGLKGRGNRPADGRSTGSSSDIPGRGHGPDDWPLTATVHFKNLIEYIDYEFCHRRFLARARAGNVQNGDHIVGQERRQRSEWGSHCRPGTLGAAARNRRAQREDVTTVCCVSWQTPRSASSRRSKSAPSKNEQ
jgi:hypothetical protein